MALTAQLSNFSPLLPKNLPAGPLPRPELIDQTGPSSTRVSTLTQRQHRLGAGEIRELAAAYEAGATVRDLTRQFGIHRSTVLAHLEREGVPRRRPRRPKLGEDDVREAGRLYRQGWSTLRLGKHFGVNAETVRKELHRAGLTLRPARGRTH